MQLNFSVTDEEFVEEFSELFDEENEEVIGHTVIVRVRDELENRREYIFIVAAGSEIALGEFSDPSDPISLSECSHVIVTCFSCDVVGIDTRINSTKNFHSR